MTNQEKAELILIDLVDFFFHFFLPSFQVQQGYRFE